MEPQKAAREGGVAAPPFGAALRLIFGSEAAFWPVMVLLFACVFTSMTGFQTTFADSRGLDFSVFYAAYTAAVIFSRFMLAGAASRLRPRLVITSSVSVMAVALASLFLIGSSVVLYGLASVALGLGYGLGLPATQALAVNVSDDSVWARVLPVAGFFFEAAFLGFPLVAGQLIAGLGYGALMALLVSLTTAQAGIAWWRFAARTRAHRWGGAS